MKEKDHRKETIELLDKAQDMIVFLTTDRETADIVRKGSPNNIQNIITLALVQDADLFMSILSSVVNVVKAQAEAGKQDYAKAAVKTIKAALKCSEDYLSSGLN